MKKLSVKIPKKKSVSYPILIGNRLLKNPKTWLPHATTYDDIVIITDSHVKKLYGKTLLQSLLDHGYPAQLLSFPAGEKSKHQETKQLLEEKMYQADCHRNTLCIALGGGVVGDLGGFVAATYMRGIPYIQIPTTLLAMVDSSVGGKTAIDTAFGKNMIGAFWQPRAVIADIDCLKSLPKKQRINGFVEAIKMFLTHHAPSFRYAELHLKEILANEDDVLSKVIYRAISIKTKVVQKDEKEDHMRMVLNFGHTMGHAIETYSNYEILHGYAVAYGILVEAKISEILGFLSAENFARIQQIFSKLGIVGQSLKEMDVRDLIQKTKSDKKVKAGKTRYVLLKNIGQIHQKDNDYAHPVADEIVRQAFLAVTME